MPRRRAIMAAAILVALLTFALLAFALWRRANPGAGRNAGSRVERLAQAAAHPWFHPLRTAQSGAETRADLATVEAASRTEIGGTVRSAISGAPVFGAEVRLERDEGVLDVTWTDARGRFLFPPNERELAAREVFQFVSAKADGFAVARSSITEENRGILEVLLDPAASIAGTVVDAAGVPVREAVVFAYDGKYDVSYAARSSKVTTAEDGGFAIVDAPPGRVTLLANDARGLGSGELNVGVLSPGGKIGGIVVRLAGRGRIVGRVLAGGIPVAGAEVDLRRPDVFANSVTDSNGEFHFDSVLPGKGVVALLDELGATDVESRAGEETRADISVWRGPVLDGVVLDEEGRPVPKVLITFEKCGADRLLPGAPSQLLERYLRVPDRYGGSEPGDYPTETNLKGEFSFRRILCPMVNLRLMPKGFLTELREEVSVPSHQQFRLRRGARVEGTIVHANGSICESANDSVFVRSSRRSARFEVHRGRFTITGMPDGDAEAEFSSRELGNGRAHFTIAGPSTSPVRLVMPGIAHARGRVLSDGMPIAGATVGAASISDRGAEIESDPFSGRTGPDGRFVIPVPLDLSTVLVFHPEFRTVVRTDLRFTAGETLDLGDIPVERGEGVLVAPIAE